MVKVRYCKKPEKVVLMKDVMPNLSQSGQQFVDDFTATVSASKEVLLLQRYIQLVRCDNGLGCLKK